MRLALVLVFALLTGCGGKWTYHPEEYPITEDRITSFKLAGKVSVENQQDDSSTRVVLSAPARDWISDYRTITDAMVTQLTKELEKHGTIANGDQKRIGLKVTDNRSYMHLFHMTGTFSVEVTLGDAAPFTLSLENGSPGNMWRILNGNTALGVIAILSDQRVLDYLAR